MSDTEENPLVIVQRQGAIASVILNRPASRNSADLAMAETLRDAVTQVCRDPDIHVVILRSSSEHFMAGGDVRRFSTLLDQDDGGKQEIDAIIVAVNQIALELNESSSIVIGLLGGSVAGVGCSLAMACDIVIAAEDTRFLMAYNGLGTTPDGGATWYLPRLLGMQRALAMVLLNQPMDAHEAKSAGLVLEVVAADQLLAHGEELAQRLVSGPVLAQGRSKILLRNSLDCDLATALERERSAFLASAVTPDFTEGVQAFVQRRKPRFGTPPVD